jgi:hypothetical protein
VAGATKDVTSAAKNVSEARAVQKQSGEEPASPQQVGGNVGAIIEQLRGALRGGGR